MTEDFILEDDEITDSTNRRPFLIAVGVLSTVGVLAIACIAIVFATRGGAAGSRSERAAIETQNAIVAVTNEAVTRTIAAMETEAARPTNTPRATATTKPTAIPTNTPQPTNTPVVQQAEEDATPELSGTSQFGGVIGAPTPTPIGGALAGTGDSALPNTGIGTWTASIAALAFLAILVVARRLRSS